MVQLAPAARIEPQLFCWLKKLGDTETPVMPSVPVPVFESVTFWGELCVPTVCDPKSMLDGERDPIPLEMPVP
jgi:hypothetical protein